jgi:hypothetical protein
MDRWLLGCYWCLRCQRQRDTSNIPVTNDEVHTDVLLCRQSMTMRCSLSAKEAAHTLVITRNAPLRTLASADILTQTCTAAVLTHSYSSLQPLAEADEQRVIVLCGVSAAARTAAAAAAPAAATLICCTT